MNVDGDIDKDNERLVAHNFSQSPEIECNEMFTPMARLYIVRMFLAIFSHKC